MERTDAVDLVGEIIEILDTQLLPVPVRELWVYGDLALGLDPLDRLDLYVTKEVLLGGSPADAATYEAEFDIPGIGTTVQVDWARAHPEYIQTNTSGYVAPERCLAAQLLPEDASIHLEVCNAGFESNVTQRLQAAADRASFDQLLDPRAVLVWRDGETATESLEKLRDGAYVFPTLAEALSMLGMEQVVAEEAANELDRWRADLEGQSVRGEVI